MLTACLSPRPIRGFMVACTRCAVCLRNKAWWWSQRAMAETIAAERTWFCTFTYRGEHEVGYDEVQKAIKRLRKKHDLRYLVTTEKGSKNGRLHYHALLHVSADVGRRDIEAQWPHGFSHLRLARSGHARYVAKYATKDGCSRPRPSQGYGVHAVERVIGGNGPIVDAVLQTFPGAHLHILRSALGEANLRAGLLGKSVRKKRPPVLAGPVPRSPEMLEEEAEVLGYIRNVLRRKPVVSPWKQPDLFYSPPPRLHGTRDALCWYDDQDAENDHQTE